MRTSLRLLAALVALTAMPAADAATILVTTATDELNADGDCSLREAVQAANTNAPVDLCTAGSATGDVITFIPALNGQTILVTLGELVLTEGVTVGTGALGTPNVILDADGASRIFRVDVAGAAQPVRFQNLTLRDGVADRGGAVLIANGQDVGFTRVRFESNTASGSGGALFTGNGVLTLTEAFFSANVSNATAPVDGGGALFNDEGLVTVSGSTFIGNWANGGTAGGGAIYNKIRGTMHVSGGYFAENRSARAGGAIESGGTLTISGGEYVANTTGNNGGAVHVRGTSSAVISGGIFRSNTADGDGGALWNSPTGTLSVTGSDIRLNRSFGPDLGQGGGGIYNAGGTLTLTDVSVRANTAETWAGAFGSGGGVYNDVGGTLTVTGGLITGNVARYGGGIKDDAGASVTLDGAAVRGNSSTAQGGGLHLTGAGSVTITDGELNQNWSYEGGALWKSGPGTLVVNGTAIKENSVTTGNGGAIYNADGAITIRDAQIDSNRAGTTQSGSFGSGGGVYNDAGGVLTITDTLIRENRAYGSGGGIYDNGGSGLTLTNVILSANSASSAGDGGGLYLAGAGVVTITGGRVVGNFSSGVGGAVWCSAAGSLAVTGTRFESNRATGSQTTGGGGLYNQGATITLTDVVFTGNVVTGQQASGGAMFNDAGGTLVVDGGTFTTNQARATGGAIANRAGASLSLTDVTFSGNGFTTSGGPVSPGDGGAIHMAGTVAVTRGTFTSNTALNEGGAIWIAAGGALTLVETTLTGNSATIGGAVFKDGAGGSVRVERSLLSANAAINGGGLYTEGGDVVLVNSTLSGNTASGVGGALQVVGGAARLTSVTVAGNTASSSGGGASQAGTGTVTLENTILADNAADAGPDCSGTLASADYNLVESVAGCALTGATANNVVGQDPMLAALADNGGPTRTRALAAGSPAVGAGTCVVGNDQRGYLRADGACDIGAFERGAVLLPPGATYLVTAPDATTVATAGGKLIVRWSGPGVPGTGDAVDLYLRKGDGPLVLIGSGENRGKLKPTLPADLASGSDYTLLVALAGDPAVYGISEPFVVSNAAEQYTFSEPDPGEFLRRGATHTVLWDTPGTAPEATVTLAFYRSGTLVASFPGEVDDGTFSLPLAANLAVGSNYRLEITNDADPAFFGRSARFSVTRVQVVGPAGDATWAAGSSQAVTWNPTGVVAGGTVKLSLRSVEGGFSRSLAINVPFANGTRTITVPADTPAGAYFVQLLYTYPPPSNTTTFYSNSNVFTVTNAASMPAPVVRHFAAPPAGEGTPETLVAVRGLSEGSEVGVFASLADGSPVLIGAGVVEGGEALIAVPSEVASGDAADGAEWAFGPGAALSLRVFDGTSERPLEAASVVLGSTGRATTLALAAGEVLVVETAEGDAASASGAAAVFALSGVVPNPSSGAATVRFSLPSAQAVTVTVYDVLGRAVATLFEGEGQAGANAVAVPAGVLPAGLYVVRLSSSGASATQRFTVVR